MHMLVEVTTHVGLSAHPFGLQGYLHALLEHVNCDAWFNVANEVQGLLSLHPQPTWPVVYGAKKIHRETSQRPLFTSKMDTPEAGLAFGSPQRCILCRGVYPSLHSCIPNICTTDDVLPAFVADSVQH
jgi:hypothetical protein